MALRTDRQNNAGQVVDATDINGIAAAVNTLIAAVAALQGNVVAAPTGIAGTPSAQNLYRAPQRVDAYVASHSSSGTATNSEFAPIQAQPQGTWLVDASNTQAQTTALVNAAAGKTTLLSFYGIPNRDNGGYSGGGFATTDAYFSWLRSHFAGIGTAPVIAILEADAVGFCSQLSGSAQDARVATLKQAVDIFAGKINILAFLDLATWVTGGASGAAALLKRMDIGLIGGFSLNVSGFNTSDSCLTFGDQVVSELAKIGVSGVKYVIDSSRNGNGPLQPSDADAGPWFSTNQPWCNPPGRRIGTNLPGSTDSSHPALYSYLWVKPVGESDGAFPTLNDSGHYGVSAPAAGQFFPEAAREMVGLTPYVQGTPASGTQFSTLAETFASGAGAFTNASAGATVSGGNVNVKADSTYASISTQPVYTLVGSAVYVKCTPAPAASGSITTQTSVTLEGSVPKTRLQINIDTKANTISFQSQVNYYDQGQITVGYDSVQMLWLRFRESGGKLYFETSPDKSSWTVRRTITTPSWVHAANDQDLSLGAYADAGSSTAVFDNVNS